MSKLKTLPPIIVAITGLIVAVDQVVLDRMFPMQSDPVAVAAFNTVRTAPAPLEATPELMPLIDPMPLSGDGPPPMPTLFPTDTGSMFGDSGGGAPGLSGLPDLPGPMPTPALEPLPMVRIVGDVVQLIE